MESDLHEELRRLERAEASPYVDYPPTPGWYFPAAGLWTAAYVGVVVWMREGGPRGLAVVAILALVALSGVFFGWYRRYHGAMPSLRGPKPPEIMRAYLGYLLLAPVVVAVVAVLIWLVPLAAPAAALVLVAGGLWLYERGYARAAARVRERLG